MERRVIAALVLSMLVLFFYQSIMAKYYPAEEKNLTQSMPAGRPQHSGEVSRQPVAGLSANTLPADEAQIEPSEEAVKNEQEFVIENSKLQVVLSDIGGSIKSVTLKQNIDAGLNAPYEIFSADHPASYLFSLHSPDGKGVFYKAKYEADHLGDGIVFSYKLQDGTEIRKEYRLAESQYVLQAVMRWANKGAGPIVQEYGLLTTRHTSPPSRIDDRFMEIKGKINGKEIKDKKRSKDFLMTRTGNVDWLLFQNRYFSTVCKPLIQISGYTIKQDEKRNLSIRLNIPPFSIPYGSSVGHTFNFYMGPSSQDMLMDANIDAGEALKTGFFGSISQLLIGALRLFHKVFKNWGVAIILLSLSVNLLLFPLTRKSYKSMHDMQSLQPKINKLKEENKSNPQKLQKEIMELYKKHKVNPMGGCLPLFVQMPVFIALYQGLMRSVELRHASFLWINDLAKQEQVPIPVTLPLIGDKINILPLLMMAGMFVQQKLSGRAASMGQTAEQKQQQRMMTVMMTVMFGFIFYSFPSGLVLYWLSNTVVMTTTQFLVTKGPAVAAEQA